MQRAGHGRPLFVAIGKLDHRVADPEARVGDASVRLQVPVELLRAECLFQKVEKLGRTLDRKARRDTMKTFGLVIHFAHGCAPQVFYFLAAAIRCFISSAEMSTT